jgi:phage baseplate assembly protein W
MTRDEIISVDWSFGLGSPGQIVQGEEDIAQCVFIIVTTQKGSDPLRPEFGVDLLSYIDSPMNIAAANLTRELATQINKWEPRVKVTDVSYKIDVSQITYRVIWKRADGTPGTTEVRYNLIQN